jgi:hypothetical protein
VRGWKIAGLAGLAGVAATGGVAHGERKSRAYTAEQVRAKLHERIGMVDVSGPEDGPESGGRA